MDAVVLVGGEGTRLRPLTLSTPKPMLPLVDRPSLAYTLEQLATAGIDRVIFGCGYLPDAIQAAFGEDGGGHVDGMRLEYAVEDRPLGTAGAIRFAAMAGRVNGTFLVLNGDILSDFDLGGLVRRHRERGAIATIALTPVDDPSRYGLVRIAADGAVLGFLEKPSPDEIDTDLINAGAYVLEPSVLDAIPDGRAVSIERETFPSLVGRGLYGERQEGYWLDVGTPESYVRAHRDVLSGRVACGPGPRLVATPVLVEPGAEIASDATLLAPVWVGPGARVESGATIGPASALGAGAHVARGAVVRGSAVHDGAHVGAGARVEDAVVGAGAIVAEAAVVDALALVAGPVASGAGSR